MIDGAAMSPVESTVKSTSPPAGVLPTFSPSLYAAEKAKFESTDGPLSILTTGGRAMS